MHIKGYFLKISLLFIMLSCFIILCSSCNTKPPYPLESDLDSFFMSHISQYTAAANILWEYGKPLLGKQDRIDLWIISRSIPNTLDNPLFLKYFTKEQWQIVGDTFNLTMSLAQISYRKDFLSYAFSAQTSLSNEPGIVFWFEIKDSMGKRATICYVYIRPSTGILQDAEENFWKEEHPRSLAEWEKLDAAYWYKVKNLYKHKY